jgi:hypothetical protein
MNAMMFATAFDNGRVGARTAQAWGLVSRTIVRREGDSSVHSLVSAPQVLWTKNFTMTSTLVVIRTIYGVHIGLE